MDKFYFKYKKNTYSLLGPTKNSVSGKILATFLDSEVINNVESYIRLLNDSEFKYGMGNAVILDKTGNGMIALTIFVFEDMEPEPEFKTTVGNLIKILKDWDYIHKKKFPKVLMTVDGDKVAFEPIEITET